MRFYLDVFDRIIQGIDVGKIDWGDSWQLHEVSDQQWDDLKQQLRAVYQKVRATMQGLDEWENEDTLGGSIAILVHSAYHLGEIRQALCTIK